MTVGRIHSGTAHPQIGGDSPRVSSEEKAATPVIAAVVSGRGNVAAMRPGTGVTQRVLHVVLAALGAGADVLGVDLPVEVLADEISDNPEEYYDEGLFEPDHKHREQHQCPDHSAPLFVGPGGHLLPSFL